MKSDGARRLSEIVAARREGIVREWLARALASYPEHTARFLAQERDRFRNPVGHTFRQALPSLFDELLGTTMDAARVARTLDGIVRIRAVQDFTAGQSVGFLFALKKILREALGVEGRGSPGAEALASLEDRIDDMVLLAFDLYMRCREQLYQIRAAEARRRASLQQGWHPMERPVDGTSRLGPEWACRMKEGDAG